MTTSKWGPADQLGAANELVPGRLMDALGLPSNGTVLDLTQPVSPVAPRADGQSPYSLCMWSHPIPSRYWHEAEGATNDVGFADERVELDLHIGTHIDALGHTSIADRLYNDLLVKDVAHNTGLAKLGVEHIPPLITRGVLLDVPPALGRTLEAGQVISVHDIERTLRHQNTQLQSGDIVLIRTGWARYYGTDNSRYVNAYPGIGLEAARWLVDQQAVAIGADTMGLEVKPGEASNVLWPVHQELLTRSGVYIIEQANLEEAAHSQAHKFLCLCLPIRFEGATASPVRLTAVL
ncbi:MAG: cyclase family protein [Steroidobacteraceae bacterium]